MDENEIKSLIDQLKAGGLDDDRIMEVFYQAFEKGKMDRDDLETLSNAMGYELTDEFKNDPAPDPIASEGEGIGDLSQEQLEDARTIDDDESPEEFEEKIDELKGEEEPEGESAPEDGSEEDPEEEDDSEDWEKAQKMFRI